MPTEHNTAHAKYQPPTHATYQPLPMLHGPHSPAETYTTCVIPTLTQIRLRNISLDNFDILATLTASTKPNAAFDTHDIMQHKCASPGPILQTQTLTKLTRIIFHPYSNPCHNGSKLGQGRALHQLVITVYPAQC